MQEPAVGFVEAAGSVRLGEKGVEAEEDAGDAEGDGVIEYLAEGGGGDRESGVGHVSDHDGVDDTHGHPADLGEDERKGEREHGANLVADGHGLQVDILSKKENPGVGRGVSFEYQYSWLDGWMGWPTGLIRSNVGSPLPICREPIHSCSCNLRSIPIPYTFNHA